MMSSATCTESFQDAGGGGVLGLTVTPDAGSTLVSWSGCSAAAGAGCQLRFDYGPDTTFNVTVTLEAASGPVPTGENLLVDPDFETLPYHTGTLPVTPNAVGFWKGDSGQVVNGSENGIRPDSGSRMLRCDATGPWSGAEGYTGCEAYQLLDVSLYSELIDQGSSAALATVTVKVNRVLGDAQTDRKFSLVLYALAEPPSAAPTPRQRAGFLERGPGHRRRSTGEFDGHYFDHAWLSLIER